MRPASVISMLRLALACLVLGLIVAVPAANAASTTQILRDCADDGVLQGDYTPAELRKARQNIPTDTDEYTDCRDVLARAAAAGVSPAAARGSGGGTGGSGGVGRRTSPLESPNTPGGQGARSAARRGAGRARSDPARRPRRSSPARAGLSRRRRPQRPAAAADRRAGAARRRRPGHPAALRPPPCPSLASSAEPAPGAAPHAHDHGPVGGAGRVADRSASRWRSCWPRSSRRGGVRAGADDSVEIGLMLGGAVVVAAACLRAAGGRLYGVPRRDRVRAAGRLHGALDHLVAGAADSWLEANRTLAYLAVLRRRASRSCGCARRAGPSCSTACSPALVARLRCGRC